MSNPQLVDYVKRQFQIGVDEASIRSALLGSGWPEEDVAEGLAEVKSAMGASAVAPSEGTPRVTVKSQTVQENFTEPQEVRPVDLRASKEEVVSGQAKPGIFKRILRLALPVGGGLVTVGALVWGFMSMSEAGELQKKIDQLGSDATNLQYQLSEITTKSSDLQGKVNVLTAESEDLQSQVALFVVPKGASSSTLAKDVTLKGTIFGGGSEQYYLKLSSGILLYVKNYKLPEVDSLLKEFSSKPAEVKGKHVSGTFEFTLEAIDGKTPTKPTSTSSTPTSTSSGA